MGTRADFYVGRGERSEWLGSVAWDGLPSGFEPDFFRPFGVDAWRASVEQELASRDDATWPDQGWPWPWEDSGTTDYAYAFDDGKVYASCFGSRWFDPLEPEPDHDDEEETKVLFPDMSARRVAAAPGTRRSGVIALGRRNG